MSLTIELAEPEMNALTELAQAEGREPEECASNILQSHLAARARLAQSTRVAASAAQISSNGQQAIRPDPRSLQGKYRHSGASSASIRADRNAEIERDEARFAERMARTGKRP